MLTWNLIDVRTVTGEQFASYFGYAVAVADVDGDGADDAIIGAPIYSDYNPNELKVEHGRVYVFYQTTKVCAVIDKHCWVSTVIQPTARVRQTGCILQLSLFALIFRKRSFPSSISLTERTADLGLVCR